MVYTCFEVNFCRSFDGLKKPRIVGRHHWDSNRILTFHITVFRQTLKAKNYPYSHDPTYHLFQWHTIPLEVSSHQADDVFEAVYAKFSPGLQSSNTDLLDIRVVESLSFKRIEIRVSPPFLFLFIIFSFYSISLLVRWNIWIFYQIISWN